MSIAKPKSLSSYFFLAIISSQNFMKHMMMSLSPQKKTNITILASKNRKRSVCKKEGFVDFFSFTCGKVSSPDS